MRRLLLLLALTGLGTAACNGSAPAEPTPETTTFAPSLGVNLSTMTKTSDGLYYVDKVVGTGAVADSRSFVDLQYTGYLTDGTLIDASQSGTAPGYRLGQRTVLQGWNEGIPGMKVGGTRQLVIPASLAYGDVGTIFIPPGAILVYTVKLVTIEPG